MKNEPSVVICGDEFGAHSLSSGRAGNEAPISKCWRNTLRGLILAHTKSTTRLMRRYTLRRNRKCPGLETA